MENVNADSVFNFVDEAQTSNTVGELNANFRRLIQPWGFEGWGCIQVSSAPSAIKAPLMRMFGEINAEWVKRYLEAQHIGYDTAAREVMRQTAPFWWSEITQPKQITKRQRLVYDEADSFGLSEGLAVPVRFPDGSVWSVMLYGRKIDDMPHLKEMAFLAGQYYAGRGLYLGDRSRATVALASRLTDRQRQVVELLRFGTTQTDAARVMGVSESTVNNLVTEAKDRLGARTTAELVAEALLSGEIGGAKRRLGDFEN